MKKSSTLPNSIIKCIHCKSEYDLVKAVRKTRELRQNEVKCPNCSKNIGII